MPFFITRGIIPQATLPHQSGTLPKDMQGAAPADRLLGGVDNRAFATREAAEATAQNEYPSASYQIVEAADAASAALQATGIRRPPRRQ